MAGTSGAWEEWERDPFEIDGDQTSSGYVRPGYYLANAWDAAIYFSLPAAIKRRVNQTYAQFTGGRDLQADAVNLVVDTVEPLKRAAGTALETAKDAVTSSIKTVAIVGAVVLVAVAVIVRE